MKKHNKNDLMAILQVFGTLWQVDCQRLFQNGTFQRVVWGGFSQSVISSGIHQLWPSSFFSKCLKFDVDSRNGTENWEKLIQFQENWIWFWSGKFSQSSTGYLRLAVYVLTNTLKISPITRGDIFQINLPQNDKRHDKSALMEIPEVFGKLSHADCQSRFRNGGF